MTSNPKSNKSEQENKYKEIIIKLLLDKYFSGDSNEVHFSKEDCKKLDILESDVSRIIHRLQQDGLLHIEIKSMHNDFSRFWVLKLESQCINYFEIKKDNTIENRRKSSSEFRAWFTLLIAILAFLLSIFSLYLQFFHTEIPPEDSYQELSQTDKTETHQSSDVTFYDTTPNE